MVEGRGRFPKELCLRKNLPVTKNFSSFLSLAER